jgi:hypothetical protein
MALSEVRVFSRSRRYAGTLDLLALWSGGALIDWKTGDPRDVAANLQLCGYHTALLEMLANDDRPDEIAFDPATHTYTLDGEVLPSVTQILAWARIIDFSQIPEPYLQAARDRGTAVHAAIHARHRGTFDAAAFAAAHPSYVPYLDAHARFMTESGVQVAATVPPAIARFAVRLKKTGAYSVEAYANPTDYLSFDTLVAAWHVAAPYRTAWAIEHSLAEAA